MFEADTEDFLLTLFNLNYNENNDIAQKLKVSEKTIEREMKKTDKVIYRGSGYSGHWEIKE